MWRGRLEGLRGFLFFYFQHIAFSRLLQSQRKFNYHQQSQGLPGLRQHALSSRSDSLQCWKANCHRTEPAPIRWPSCGGDAFWCVRKNDADDDKHENEQGVTGLLAARAAATQRYGKQSQHHHQHHHYQQLRRRHRVANVLEWKLRVFVMIEFELQSATTTAAATTTSIWKISHVVALLFLELVVAARSVSLPVRCLLSVICGALCTAFPWRSGQAFA